MTRDNTITSLQTAEKELSNLIEQLQTDQPIDPQKLTFNMAGILNILMEVTKAYNPQLNAIFNNANIQPLAIPNQDIRKHHVLFNKSTNTMVIRQHKSIHNLWGILKPSKYIIEKLKKAIADDLKINPSIIRVEFK